MAKYLLGGRPSKAVLSKIKVGTVVVSIATFLATLGGIAAFNPGFSNGAAASSQSVSSTQIIASASQSSSSNRQSINQQQGIVFPAVRTRGS